MDSTGELDVRHPRSSGSGCASASDPPNPDQPQKAWLGAVTRNDGGRLLVTQVRRDTPASQAGFNVDDEIVAIDEHRVRPEGWDARMEAYRPGDRVSDPGGTARASDASSRRRSGLNLARRGASNSSTTQLTSSEPDSSGGSPGMLSRAAEPQPISRARRLRPSSNPAAHDTQATIVRSAVPLRRHTVEHGTC